MSSCLFRSGPAVAGSLNSTSEATASTGLSQLLRTDHVPAGHGRVWWARCLLPGPPRQNLFSTLQQNLPSKIPAAPAPFPPTPCAPCGPQIRALSLSHLGSHPAQDEHSNGRRPSRSRHPFRSFTNHLVLLATKAAPHLKSMSLANRHSTVATTPASQTTRERDQHLAGAGSKPADFRAPADEHAGATTSSLQDRSFGTHTVGGKMTGHHAEEEGRPPYSHVRTMTPAPRAPRDGAVAARAGG